MFCYFIDIGALSYYENDVQIVNIPNGNNVYHVLIMPQLHLLRSSYDLFVYDFPYDFFGIVGGYKLRRMCLHCLRSPYDFFGDKLGQNLTEPLRISYDNSSNGRH